MQLINEVISVAEISHVKYNTENDRIFVFSKYNFDKKILIYLHISKGILSFYVVYIFCYLKK